MTCTATQALCLAADTKVQTDRLLDLHIPVAKVLVMVLWCFSNPTNVW